VISIRSGRGLGDALYLQGVARHMVERGQEVEVCTGWPDVFMPLFGRLRVSPFRKDRLDRVAHYVSRKTIMDTDQFTDCCISAGITEKVDFRLDWQVVNPIWHEMAPKPLVLVQLPRDPMDRKDGYGMELLPDCRMIQHAIDALRERGVRVVQVGKGEPLYTFRNLTADLANKTSVTDLLDIASLANGMLGYCSFMAPLAECLNKPALLVWSQKGLRSRNPFIRQIVPQKIFNKPSSRAVMDDCSDAELIGAVDALLEQIRSPAVV
jgi:hypothetical protein